MASVDKKNNTLFPSRTSFRRSKCSFFSGQSEIEENTLGKRLEQQREESKEDEGITSNYRSIKNIKTLMI